MTTIERRIIRQLIADLLDAGYAISVSDGEDGFFLRQSRDFNAIQVALGTMDEDLLYATAAAAAAGHVPKHTSFVHLVYGNDGWDVICDNSVSLEPALTRTNALVEKLSA